MASVHAYDTLGYSKILIEGGFTQKQAEALASANRDFFSGDIATKEFVRSEIQRENALLEARLTRSLGKMIAVAVGVLLAGIPLIQALLLKAASI